ncbi:MAG TPA: hypothetical protein VF668_08890 [Pyrinomonadaceae bacterium]
MGEDEEEGAGGEGVEGKRRGDNDARWHPVYWAVVVTTALVIAALWVFSRAFS